MSRIGKKIITLPEGVTVQITGSKITTKGPKGELSREISSDFVMEVKDKELTIAPKNPNRKKTSAFWGLYRSLIANMVEGVHIGFSKRLEFEGVGYRAAMDGENLVMQLGFSHPVKFTTLPGVKLTTEKNAITVSGCDKEAVGEVAARIRRLKPVEPYKGKGIRYQGEIFRRKAGKKAVSTG